MTWKHKLESAANGAQITYLYEQSRPAEVFIDQGEKMGGNIVVTDRKYRTLAYFTPAEGDTSDAAFERVREALEIAP